MQISLGRILTDMVLNQKQNGASFTMPTAIKINYVKKNKITFRLEYKVILTLKI